MLESANTIDFSYIAVEGQRTISCEAWRGILPCRFLIVCNADPGNEDFSNECGFPSGLKSSIDWLRFIRTLFNKSLCMCFSKTHISSPKAQLKWMFVLIQNLFLHPLAFVMPAECETQNILWLWSIGWTSEFWNQVLPRMKSFMHPLM